MSSDSLGVASHEEDSSDEGHSTRGRPRDEEQENSDIHAEGKKDFQSDEKEQLSEPLVVKCDIYSHMLSASWWKILGLDSYHSTIFWGAQASCLQRNIMHSQCSAVIMCCVLPS